MLPLTIEGTSSDHSKKISLRSALRLSMPVTTLLYCAAFNYAYVGWVSPIWSYEGFIYKSPNMALLILGYILAAATGVISPLRLHKPSQVAYWLLYFTVYIPGMFVPIYCQLDNGLTLLFLQLSLTCGMLPIALSYRISPLKLRRFPLEPRLFWACFGAFFILGNAIIFYAFRSNLQFASIGEVYSVRVPAKQLVRENPALGYISQLLSIVMNPLLMAYGLASRRKTLFALGTLGEFLLYSTAAAKQLIVGPLVIFAFYYTIKRDLGGWVPKMGLIFSGLLVALTTIAIGARTGVIFNLASIILVRTFAMPGMLIAQYQYFFETFPHTYLGHVRGINLLFPNPYSLQLGEEVSSFFGITSTHGIVNSDASFFAMDGIAGFGLIGIPLMGLFCAAVFWILDSCARNYSLKFAVPVLTMIIISLENASLFTTLLGNGLILWMLLFIIMPGNLPSVVRHSDGHL